MTLDIDFFPKSTCSLILQVLKNFLMCQFEFREGLTIHFNMWIHYVKSNLSLFSTFICTSDLDVFDTFWKKIPNQSFLQVSTKGLLVFHLLFVAICRYLGQPNFNGRFLSTQDLIWFIIAKIILSVKRQWVLSQRIQWYFSPTVYWIRNAIKRKDSRFVYISTSIRYRFRLCTALFSVLFNAASRKSIGKYRPEPSKKC